MCKVKIKRPETFVEDVIPTRVQNVSLYIALGWQNSVIESTEMWHVLQRLTYDTRLMAVRREDLATLHARIVAVAADPATGERSFKVAGVGRSGRPFSFDISERSYWQPRAFAVKMNNFAGAETILYAGKICATARAIWQLSNLGGTKE
jgi:hypothetical protein